MSTSTRYLFGRGLAHAMIIIGWIVGGLVVVVATFVACIPGDKTPLVIRAAIGLVVGCLAGGLIGAINHGAWQALVALFDIADHTQDQTDILQRIDWRGAQHEQPPRSQRVVTSAPTAGELWAPPDPPPRPTPPVFTPSGKLPGETDDQWARRIEREEVAAFQNKRAQR